MTRSQQIAAAVAMRAAGYRVQSNPTGALVEQVAGDAPAAGKLLPTDVIVSAAGRKVRSPAICATRSGACARARRCDWSCAAARDRGL